MVRTYRNDGYRLVSPWEQAMRNADADADRPHVTGKRMYSNVNISQQSGENHLNVKLPPLSQDPNQPRRFLLEEAGKVLARSKDKLKKIKSEFLLYDPFDTGLISKSSACEILKRYSVPKEEGYQIKLVELFVDKNNKSKIHRFELVEQFEVSKKAIKEKTELSKTQDIKPENYSDSVSGRYDSEGTMQKEHNHIQKRGEVARMAFIERRDAGLLLELETAFQKYGKVDPNILIDHLEDHLQKTCRNDQNLVDNMHMKGLLDKHEFPINSALALKCIERLDPTDMGRIQWPPFISFLKKAVRNTPRRVQTVYHEEINQTPVPERPAWERKKPLSDIHKKQNGEKNAEKQTYYDHHQNMWNSGDQESAYQYERFDNQNNENPEDKFYDLYQKNTTTSEEDSDFNMNPYAMYKDQENHNSKEEEILNQSAENFQYMDENLEAAFALNLNKLRAEYNQDDFEPQQSNFDLNGPRGEAYKRVADALTDKGIHSEGLITTNEVEKMINYYNLLFDTNIQMEQVHGVFNQHANNGRIYVKHIIDSLGKDIL